VAVASAGPYASLHLAPDRQPCQHPTTQFLQAGCPSCRPTNSIKALKALQNSYSWNKNICVCSEAIEHPVRTNQIPRQIPDQSMYIRTVPGILMGGILPFGCIFIQLFFILNSIWSAANCISISFKLIFDQMAQDKWIMYTLCQYFNLFCFLV